MQCSNRFVVVTVFEACRNGITGNSRHVFSASQHHDSLVVKIHEVFVYRWGEIVQFMDGEFALLMSFV